MDHNMVSDLTDYGPKFFTN